MRKIFLPIIALLACMLGSCSDEIDYTLSNDCIITGFTLEQVKRTMHTTDADGNDSTYTINYSGGYYPMTIDQINNKIYNQDSLPYGSDPSSILASLSCVGSVAYCIAGEAEPEWKMYSSSDSIDFSYLLKFRVMSNDGKAYRDYEVKLNVHQQDGEEFVWQKVSENAPFEDMKQTKAVFWNNQIFVLGRKDGAIYASRQEQNQWTLIPTSGCELAEISSLTVLNNKLYLNTTDGRILVSENGSIWSPAGNGLSIDHLIAATENRLFALAGGEIVYSKDAGINWEKDSIDTPSAWLPTQDVTGIYYELNNGNQQMVLAGNRAPEVFAQDTTAMVWSKLFLAQSQKEQPWIYYPVTAENTFPCPNLSNLSLVRYNNNIIALGGIPVNGTGGIAYNKLYVSKDNGITWKEDEDIVMPYTIKGTSECVAATADDDQFIWLICGKNVWKGRHNELGFN